MKKVILYSNVLGVIILFLSIIFFVQNAYINQDAAYYLGIARDISSGDVLYKDVHSVYAPMMMYLNALLYIIFNEPSYEIFLCFQVFITIIIGVVYYFIQKKNKQSATISFLMSLILVLTILIIDGKYIILEVYCVLFLMFAYLAYLYKKYFLVGIFICLGILSKQYAIINIIPFTLLLFPHNNLKKLSSYKPFLYYIAGGFSITFIFFGYFLIIEKLEFWNILFQLSGEGYGGRHVQYSYPIFLFLYNERIAILLLLFSIILAKGKLKNRVTIFLLMGFILNLVPTFIKQYPHYYLLSIPYAFLIFSYNVKNVKNVYSVMLVLILFYLSFMNIRQISQKVEPSKEQQAISKKALKLYPYGSKVFIPNNLRYLYIINDYKNPLSQNLGYSFEIDLDTINVENVNILKRKDLGLE